MPHGQHILSYGFNTIENSCKRIEKNGISPLFWRSAMPQVLGLSLRLRLRLVLVDLQNSGPKAKKNYRNRCEDQTLTGTIDFLSISGKVKCSKTERSDRLKKSSTFSMIVKRQTTCIFNVRWRHAGNRRFFKSRWQRIIEFGRWAAL